MWKWRSFADDNEVVVIAPSFGFGFWDRDGGLDLLQGVISYADASNEFDVSSRYLIGLSNGGIGVTRFGTELHEQFDGLAMISPVMESKRRTEAEFVSAWRSRPVFVLHGEEDRRIPREYVRRKCAALVAGGVSLRRESFENEDHFLMFSSWEDVSERIGEWLGNVELI